MSQALSQLPVGALVVDFDTKYNDEPIIWQVLEHDHDGVGTTTLCSRDILTLKCFDAKEPNNSDNNRKTNGNNRYKFSNLLQWLNSERAANSWYIAQHGYDAAPNSSNVGQVSGVAINPYDTEAGFLTNFSDNLKNSLQTVSKITALNPVTDGGGSEEVSSKVFLLSTTEVGLADENNIAEGTIYEYYLSDAAYKRQKNLANNNAKGNYNNATNPWIWRLRTMNAGDSCSCRTVADNGLRSSGGADFGYFGVAPAIVIPSLIKVGDTPAADGVYALFSGWNVKKVYIGDENGESKQIESTPVKIVSWQNGTDEEIAAMVQAADEGLIDLGDYWSVGDERQVSLGAIASSGTANGVSWSVGESQSAQTVTMVLMHKGGYNLTSATSGGRQQCSFVIGLKNSLATVGYMNSSSTNNGSWSSCARRNWCNGGFWNAVPSTLRPIFKQFSVIAAQKYNGSTNQTTQDWFALPAAAEVFKGDSSYGQGGTAAGQQTAYSNLTEFNALFRFTWYETTSNRVKKLGDTGSDNTWWERSPYFNNSTHFGIANGIGNATINSASGTYGLAPFGCI